VVNDFVLAVQTGLFSALSNSSVTTLAKVFQHLPEGVQAVTGLGLVIIGDMAAEPAAGKGGGLDRIVAEIVTLVRDPGRSHLTPVMSAVRAAIEDQLIAAQGYLISRPVFEGSDDTLLDDGETYLGTQRFSMFVQNA
jgi:hypothetical protein